MSASLIYDAVPLGSVVEYYDETPRPPDRFTKKLAAWKQRNGRGRLVQKQPGRVMATYTSQPSFTLHEGDFGQGGVILITVRRTYGIDTDLRFRVTERPKAGQARVVQSIGDGTEMLHLAESRAAAEAWLARAGYNRSHIEEITEKEAGILIGQCALPDVS